MVSLSPLVFFPSSFSLCPFGASLVAQMVKNQPEITLKSNQGLIPGGGRSPGEGNGKPLQCSCLENAMDRGAWWATIPEVTKSQTQLSD